MKTDLKKGEKMEEELKNYFLNQGYFATRSVKYVFDGFDITDIDLYLYNVNQTGTRERAIVDIKNKKSPQALERILWTRGLATALRTQCIVATTERRDHVKKFGRIVGATILDGNFLGSLPPIDPLRLTEEDFISEIKDKDPSLTSEWIKRYEGIKAVLLTGMDYSGLNWLLNQVKYFIEVIATNFQRRTAACRMLYLAISHSLLVIDFNLRDFAFSTTEERKLNIVDGLKFGNLGKQGFDKTVNLAIQLSRKDPTAARKEIYALYDNIPIDIIAEYFSKELNIKNAFENCKKFLFNAYEVDLKLPLQLDAELKGLVLLFADYHQIDRTKFLDFFK